ncbi:S1 family peptidase [Candidatus Phytoplasma sacchari]|nr:serine protease [Candidatus Phytoplasma sacchari]KAB8122859.1 trypsin-like peptidase domain-containing protein [Candidatus Phytoplasma sacchari]
MKFKNFFNNKNKKTKKNIINEKIIFLISIFYILSLIIFYKKILNILEKQQINTIKEYIVKNNPNEKIKKLENKNTFLKDNIIQNQKKLRNIFDKKQNDDDFELKNHNIRKGDYVYAFVLDNNEKNQKPFQEGIISKDYNEKKIYFLPISIKGKNNKIFFNKKGDFIGISLPLQNEESQINYIITSNLIFHLINCHILHKYNTDLFQQDNLMKYASKYYIKLSFKTKNNQKDNNDKQEEEEKNTETIEICLNKEGLFIGLKFNEKFLQISKIFNEYSLCENCIEFLKDEDNNKEYEDNKIDDKQNFQKNIPNYKNFYQIDKNEEELKEKIKELSQITFLVKTEKSLGSGFIFKIEKIKNENKYKYYILTNRHVIKTDSENEDIISVYNKYFFLKKIDKLLFIDNQIDYDDVAILTFEEDIDQQNTEKFNQVQKILEYAFPKNKKIDINQGDKVYSMGSQISTVPTIHLSLKIIDQIKNLSNFLISNTNNIYDLYDKMSKFYQSNDIQEKIEINLLKKGNIMAFNNEMIIFDITIDSGNSGGPVFNEKGEIIGINRSIVKNIYFADEFSHSINMNHVNQILDEKYWEKNQYFINKKNDHLKEKIKKFKSIIEKETITANSENPKLTIFMDEIFNILSKNKFSFNNQISPQNIILFRTPIIKKSQNEIKIMINLFKTIDVPAKIFYFDPTEEIIELQLNIINNNEKLKFLIKFIKKNKKNQITDTKEINFNLQKNDDNGIINFEEHKDLNSFLTLELFHFVPKNKINIQEKIKRSLVVWQKRDRGNVIEGNGIIFHKEKLQNGNFLYFVLSNFNGDVNLIDEIKNIFFDYAEITTYKSNIYEKEKIKINSFYSTEMNNLVLMSFESNYEYESVQITPISDISIGDEIYFINNINNENYFPQIFKSNIGNIIEETKSFLFDSVFDLKEKPVMKNFKLNFLCFDKEGNFIGFNDHIKYQNNKFMPSHFIQGSFLKKENLLPLFIKKKIKEKINVIFTAIFVIISFNILLKIISQNKINKNKIKL